MKTVIIAEKPSVARVIASVVGAKENHFMDGFLAGNEYVVTWAYGHLVALAQPLDYGFKSYERASLPMLPEMFKLIPRQIKSDKGFIDDVRAVNQLEVIRRLFEAADKIIVATDAGREGELIFRYIYQYLECKKPFFRLWVSSLTDTAIRKALKELKPGNQYDNLYYAARARSESDWLIGMNASQALTLAAGEGVFSLGRVQTPTLKMIVERYNENKNFIPVKYWQLQLTAEKFGVSFKALSKIKYPCKADAESVLQILRSDSRAEVIHATVNQVTVQPPLFYDLTTLQKDANKLFGFPADKTLFVAQLLYEKQLISYPRTGSRYLPDDVFAELPGIIQNLEQYPVFSNYCISLKNKVLNSRSVNNSKVTDHHALIPTITHLPNFLAEDEERIFNLIAGRMLEAVSEACIKDEIVIELRSHDVEFSAKGSTIKKSGWKEVFRCFKTKVTEEDNSILPICKEGELLSVSEISHIEKQTQPKPILTDASLLSLMEHAGTDLEDEEERDVIKGTGIGTPATRAGIIEVLIHRQYVRRDKKKIVPTEKGQTTYEIVKDMRISDVGLTAGWEAALNNIEEGVLQPNTFRQEVEIYTVQVTTELLNVTVNLPENKSCVCPKCNSKMLFFPKCVKCANVECDFIVFRNKCDKQLSDEQIIMLIKEGKTGVIKGFKKRDGSLMDAKLKLDENYKTVFEFPMKKSNPKKR